jgi:tetratricopeptide (TPR) repeat protein
MGDFDQAIARIDRALALAPQKGLYYYGRGRVHLLAGQEEKAMADFHKAADLGDEDAINLLQKDDMSRQ